MGSFAIILSMNIIIVIISILLVYVAFKVYEINMRLRISDLRQRVFELLMGWREGSGKKWAGAYNDLVDGLEVKDYEKLVAFGREHDLQLPLHTIAEEKLRIERLTQTKEGIEQLNNEKQEKTSRIMSGYRKASKDKE